MRAIITTYLLLTFRRLCSCPEAGTIELERVLTGRNEGDVGVAGFWAAELRSWRDRVAIMQKREELGY